MYIEPNEEMILYGMDCGLNEEDAKRGYDIFNFDRTGLLQINKLDCVFCGTGIDKYDSVTDEDCARHAAQTGFCKIIPIDELPPTMIYKNDNIRYYGWIDTPDNRKNINKFFTDNTLSISKNITIKNNIPIEDPISLATAINEWTASREQYPDSEDMLLIAEINDATDPTDKIYIFLDKENNNYSLIAEDYDTIIETNDIGNDLNNLSDNIFTNFIQNIIANHIN